MAGISVSTSQLLVEEIEQLASGDLSHEIKFPQVDAQTAHVLGKLEELRQDLVQRETRMQHMQYALGRVRSGVAVTDEQGNMLFVNKKWGMVHGYTTPIKLGQPITNFFADTNKESVTQIVTRTLEQSDGYVAEHYHLYEDGSTFPVILHVYAAEDGDEDTPARTLTWSVEDITTQRELEAQLEKSKERYASLINSIDDLIFVVDKTGVFREYYQPREKITSYMLSEDFVGRSYKDVFPSEVAKAFKASVDRVMSTQQSQEFVYKLGLDKQDKYFNAKVAMLVAPDDEQEMLFSVIVRDVTEERKNEAALKEISDRLTLATESAHIGVWDWDVKNNLLVWDDQMYHLYGIQRKDFSSAYEAWRNRLHPDDTDRADDEIRKALKGESTFDTTFRIKTADNSIRYLRAFAKVQHDEQGQAVKMIGVNWDVTREMEMDQAKTEFVSLASHQLRTPLSTINWYAEMLMEGDVGSLTKEQKQYLQEIYIGNQRMVALVNALLNVSRIELGTFVVEPTAVDLCAACKEIVGELTSLIKEKKTKIDIHCDKGLDQYYGDPKLLMIIFQNLISNAIKYTPDRGTVNVKIVRDVDKKVVQFSVQDDGLGIPKNQQDKIFTKLFRADNVRETDTQGTGLGLYIVKSIIDHSSGRVWFDSEKDRGTTFYVELPLGGMKQKKGSKPLE